MKTLKLVLTIAGLSLLSAPALAAGDAAKGKELSATCAACHGPDGNSPSPQFPIIAGQYPDYLVKALQDYKSGARNNAIMAGFAAGLSQQDMEDLAAYFAQQESKLAIIPKP